MSEQHTGIYFDGDINRKRHVALVFAAMLEILENGELRAAWPYAELRRLPSSDNTLRLRSARAEQLAALEIREPGTRAEIERHCPMLADDITLDANASALKIVFWSFAATAAIIGLMWFGLPFAADCIAPLVPLSWEKRLGMVTEEKVREILGGKSCASGTGVAALAKLSKRLQEVSRPGAPTSIEVLSSPSTNALALPGGKIFLLKGMIDKANSQDEVLRVLAHEFGHLQTRDNLRSLIVNVAAASLFDRIFLDQIGGRFIFQVGKTLFTAANSLETEAQADAFAAQTLVALGRPTKPMGELLLRATGRQLDNFLAILHNHPPSEERLAKLAAADRGARAPPILTDAEWKALKAICD